MILRRDSALPLYAGRNPFLYLYVTWKVSISQFKILYRGVEVAGLIEDCSAFDVLAETELPHLTFVKKIVLLYQMRNQSDLAE